MHEVESQSVHFRPYVEHGWHVPVEVRKFPLEHERHELESQVKHKEL